jgi:hypothetical protein
MMARFTRIYREFGKAALARTLLVGIGMLAMGVAAVVLFRRVDTLLIPIGLTAIGFVARTSIANQVEKLPVAFNLGLTIYSIVLILGDRFGIAHEWKLFIITLTTTLVFNFQFWSLSDPDVYNSEKHTARQP